MNTPHSDDSPAHLPDDAVEVGRVLDAWGVKGGLKILPYSAEPQALFSTKRWYLQPPDERYLPQSARLATAAARPRWPMLLKVIQAREHGDGIVATVQDVEDRTAAESLKGARVFVSRSSFPTADANEFYWIDLIGLRVVNRDHADLGTVADLLDTGVHSVLRIEHALPDGRRIERLIPFVDAYIDQVDLPARCITVDWQPEWDEPAAEAPASQAATAPARKRRPRKSGTPSTPQAAPGIDQDPS